MIYVYLIWSPRFYSVALNLFGVLQVHAFRLHRFIISASVRLMQRIPGLWDAKS